MKFKKFLVFLLIAALFIGTASALDISYQDGWSYGTYYCPHEGTAVAYHDSIQTTTEVYFSYTNANDLLKIETENNKGNYVGLDIKDL